MSCSCFLRASLLITFIAISAGCGGGVGPVNNPVLRVEGTVTVDGKPLPEGEIAFVGGSHESLPIKDGKFSGKATAGEKRVEIRGFDGVEPRPESLAKEMPYTPVPKDALPEIYRGPASPLTATVGTDGKLTPNTFDVKSH